MDKRLIAALLMLLALACVAGGWWLGRPAPVIETAKPAETQGDGSVIVARGDTNPKARPKQKTPKGSKVERIEEVTVQPTATAEAGKPCPPVKVDMTLVRMPDDTRRVIASSPDGDIVGGLDVPVETTISVKSPEWAAGLSFDPIHQAAGVWLERDVSRFRIGVDINQRRNGMAFDGAEARVRIGWRF